MDLKDFTPKSDIVKVELKHPSSGEPLTNNDGSNMTIELYAPHTKEYKEALYEQTDKRLTLVQNSGSKDIKARDIDVASLDLLAKVTKYWSITYDDKKVKLTPEKAKELYTELFWLKPQLEEAVDSFEAFT